MDKWDYSFVKMQNVQHQEWPLLYLGDSELSLGILGVINIPLWLGYGCSGEDYTCMGQRGFGSTLLNFSVNVKLSKKFI